MIRLVAAWLGRLLVLALAAMCFAGPPGSLDEQPLNVLAYALGAAFLGLLLATFRSTSRVGGVLLGVGLWACFTGYGLIAFLSPFDVVADSRLSRRGPDLDSALGAYAFGLLILAIGNAPLVLWWWTRRSAARTERRVQDLLQPPDQTPEQRAEQARLAEADERRRRERRTRQSRRKRRARR